MLFYLSLQVGTNMQTFVSSVNTFQPFLLRIREHKSSIQKLYFIMDKKAFKSVFDIDELFKAHFVFSTSYSEALYSCTAADIKNTGTERYVYDGYWLVRNDNLKD